MNWAHEQASRVVDSKDAQLGWVAKLRNLGSCRSSVRPSTQTSPHRTESGCRLAELVGFDEKALGALIALYAEVVI